MFSQPFIKTMQRTIRLLFVGSLISIALFSTTSPPIASAATLSSNPIYTYPVGQAFATTEDAAIAEAKADIDEYEAEHPNRTCWYDDDDIFTDDMGKNWFIAEVWATCVTYY